MPDSRAGRQTRYIPATISTRNEGPEPIIACYFAVFNSPTELWRGCIEQIAPGAFSSSLGRDVRALIDHETRLVLGRTTAGTLKLQEDENGLFGEIKINPQDSDAMNLYARVQRGDVSQCSFGFEILAEDYVEDTSGQTCTWTIRDLILYEVSVVTFPAYEATSAVARDASGVTSLQTARRDRRKKELLERIKKNAEN